MPYIEVRKVKESIKNLTENMTVGEAIGQLEWIRRGQKCIDCKEQCNDCIIDFEDKIAIVKILEYLEKIGVRTWDK